MSPAVREFRKHLAGRDLTFQVSQFAHQADGAVTVRYGDTVVLGTCLMAEPRPGLDFMPLLVEYEEKFYAAGKIKGSRFVKREGKPTDIAIVTSRLVDRSIRPLFPKGMRDDVQVVTTVLSYDDENEADVVALLAASAALAVSRIPWEGPLGAVRMGRKDGVWVVNPTAREIDTGDLDLVVAATEKETVMLEADAAEIPEAELLSAIEAGTAVARELAGFIREIQKQEGKPKSSGLFTKFPENLMTAVRNAGRREMEKILETSESKLQRHERMEELTARLAEQLGETEERKTAVRILCRDLHRELVREWILDSGRRVGGRKTDTVRPLEIGVGVLPRTHGSAMFQRGETQILSVTTLGAPDDTLILDTMTEEDTKKRFFHFYNMPGFSVGEIKPNRGPGRRDIGHGMLAERALARLMPRKEDFPYTVMVVSEVLGSNGSSSMGSVCAASLALMDAGIPFPRHVAGIAMGLVTDETEKGRTPVVLTDIAGMEDEGGDMDFKVAGTRNGVTALQVDIKIPGLSQTSMTQALRGARAAYESILEAMERVLPAPRAELSPYAPRIVTFAIKPEKIREVIGPRGTMINKIIEETGTDITVEDDGQVSITGANAEGLRKATEWIKSLTREVTTGEEFSGRVTRLMNFGAFVELFPGTEGLVHISEFGPGFVRRIEDVATVGDTLPVVVKEIDTLGRINLSLQGAAARTREREDSGGGEARWHDHRVGDRGRTQSRGDTRRRLPPRRSGSPPRRPGAFRR